MFSPKPSNDRVKTLNIVQGSPDQGGFKRGYQSFVTDSRMPHDGLADLTNATLDQDNLPRPRESLVLFGEQPLGSLLGVGTFIKVVAGVPEKWDISMQVIGGVGKVCVRKDGETWIAIVDGDNSYSATAIVNFCQTNKRVYISNGVNTMSYYDVDGGTIEKYNALLAPSTPTATGTGLTGAVFTYHYRITSNNRVGESAASVAGDVSVVISRDYWAPATQYVTVTWSAVAGAESYNIYVGTVAGEEQYLSSTVGLSFKDDGVAGIAGASNSFKLAPPSDTTTGPTLKSMWNSNGQIYGVGDATNPERLWYDGGTGSSGAFTAFHNGGYVEINPGGDTTPVAVRSFRTGKGDPVVTVLSRGIGGTGKMHHITMGTLTFDGQSYAYPNVAEANGQAGTVSSRAVLECNNSLWYPTGQDFKSTGTSANIQNILSTNSISNDIIPDVRKLNLSAMDEACGLVYESKLYWSLPVSASENNQIWVKDLSRKGIWIMPWIISAKFMWLSEDNDSGDISFCIYNGTNILKFSRSVATQDNGIPFNTRVAHEGLVWGDSGMTMAAIQDMRFKLLQPSGTIKINTFGLDEDGETNTLAVDTFTQTSSFTAWGQMNWSDGELPSMWSADIGVINFTSTAIQVVLLEVDETLNQVGWEIITDTAGCDYYLSSVLTRGIEIQNSYFGD
jgi:hypothetical protein